MSNFRKIEWEVNLHKNKIMPGQIMNEAFLRCDPDYFENKTNRREIIERVVLSHAVYIAQEIYNDLKAEMEKKGCTEAKLEVLCADPFHSFIVTIHNVEFMVVYGQELGTVNWIIQVSFNGEIR